MRVWHWLDEEIQMPRMYAIIAIVAMSKAGIDTLAWILEAIF